MGTATSDDKALTTTQFDSVLSQNISIQEERGDSHGFQNVCYPSSRRMTDPLQRIGLQCFSMDDRSTIVCSYSVIVNQHLDKDIEPNKEEKSNFSPSVIGGE